MDINSLPLKYQRQAYHQLANGKPKENDNSAALRGSIKEQGRALALPEAIPIQKETGMQITLKPSALSIPLLKAGFAKMTRSKKSLKSGKKATGAKPKQKRKQTGHLYERDRSLN